MVDGVEKYNQEKQQSSEFPHSGVLRCYLHILIHSECTIFCQSNFPSEIVSL